MFSFRFVVLAAALLHQAVALVIPEGALERRSFTCPGGGKSPCVCGGQIGIKGSENKCLDGRFVFADPADNANGNMVKEPGGRIPSVQCDHLVEAQFVAQRFITGSAMCAHFLSPQGAEDLKSFKKVFNTPAGGNFVFLNGEVNKAKGTFIGGGTISGRRKLALGVASYLTQTRADAVAAAQALKTEMDRIAASAGFPSFPASFVSDYDALIATTITRATTRAAQLPLVGPPPKKAKKPKQKAPAKATGSKTPTARQKAAQKAADAKKKKAALKQKATGKKTKT